VTDIALEGLKNLEIGKNRVKVSRAQAESALKNIADLKPKEASNAVKINNIIFCLKNKINILVN
jgi:hypothetical protein